MGHLLPLFRLPYDKYRQRADRLYEQAGLAPWERSNFRPFYGGFREFFRRSLRPYEGLDRDTFDHLSQACVQMGGRLVDNASDTDLFLSGTGLLRVAEKARLSELDLPEAEARAARLHLGQAVALLRLCSRWSEDEFHTFFSVAFIIFSVWPPSGSFASATHRMAGGADRRVVSPRLPAIVRRERLYLLYLLRRRYGRTSEPGNADAL